jgi:putative photosynthetic complex assembly protein
VSTLARERSFPRGPLLAAAGLIGLSLLAASVARLGGLPGTALPDAAPAQSRELRFEDRDDGAVVVRDGRDDGTVAVLAPGTNGFIRAVMRGLVRDRKRRDDGPEIPFRLSRWDDGRLLLEDPATGARVELESFSVTNAGAFAGLLTGGRELP